MSILSPARSTSLSVNLKPAMAPDGRGSGKRYRPGWSGCVASASSPESLLVHSQMTDGLGLATCQSTPDGPIHDAVDFVPTQPQLLGDSFLAGGFQPGNGEGFKKSREAAGWFSPGQLQHAHAMSRALGARRLGVEDGAV